MAASWALVFAAPHFYWGMGGTAGLTTSLNRQVLDHRTGAFLAGVWILGVICAAGGLDIYVEFGFGLTGITTVAAGEQAEFLRLSRRFLFLWLPWFTLGAIAWGALATGRSTQGRP